MKLSYCIFSAYFDISDAFLGHFYMFHSVIRKFDTIYFDSVLKEKKNRVFIFKMVWPIVPDKYDVLFIEVVLHYLHCCV